MAGREIFGAHTPCGGMRDRQSVKPGMRGHNRRRVIAGVDRHVLDTPPDHCARCLGRRRFISWICRRQEPELPRRCRCGFHHPCQPAPRRACRDRSKLGRLVADRAPRRGLLGLDGLSQRFGVRDCASGHGNREPGERLVQRRIAGLRGSWGGGGRTQSELRQASLAIGPVPAKSRPRALRRRHLSVLRSKCVYRASGRAILHHQRRE